MHFGFVPMTGDNRVCAKEVINRNILRQIQEELPKYLQKAGFDIERGEVNSEAVHRTVKQYKADMEKENASLRKENQQLKAFNEALNSQLTSEQSMSKQLSLKKLEAEVHELRKFKQMAEKFLAEHGLKDYFRKAFIHSNNQEL